MNITVGYARFSTVDGWNLEGGLRSRKSVYSGLTPSERAVVDEDLVQPEEFGYGVCYVSLGQFVIGHYSSCLSWYACMCTQNI